MVLIDTSTEGHHKIYQDALLKIQNTKLVLIEKKLSLSKLKIKYFYELYKIVNSERKKDVHFLTLDVLYKYPLLFKLNKRRTVIGTLHKIPNSSVKRSLLKNFAKKIDFIIVHSEFSKEALNMIGIENVITIEYPSFYDYSTISDKKKIRENKKIPEDKIIISALGGTREDKGLDILLESFKYLDEGNKNKIILNILGKEEKFKKEFIDLKLKEYKITSVENYQFSTDKEFMENVKITDIMVLPYKKKFSGSSGPMIEAVVNKIPCIAPRELEIGKLIEKYELGLTFECENSQKLAMTIKDMIENERVFFRNDYNKKITISNFLDKHKNIYK